MQNVIIVTSEIIERLKQARGYEKDADLARELNVPPKKLGVWKLRNTVPLEELTTFCRRFGYNLEWALTGNGKVRKELTNYRDQEETFLVSERRQDYLNPITKGIMDALVDMDNENKNDILRYVEEKKLLAELKKERQNKKTG